AFRGPQEANGQKPFPEGWHELRSKEGGFRVAMVGPAMKLPLQSSSKDLKITWFAGVDVNKGRATSVGYYEIAMPSEAPALLNKEWQTVLLDKFAPSMPQGPQGKAKSAKFRKIAVGKYRGLESESEEGNAFFALRCVLVGKRAFLLSVEARNAVDGRPLAA